MIKIRVESQMRSGSHFFINGLATAYMGKVSMLRDGECRTVSQESVEEGLYEEGRNRWGENAIVYHNHYYHSVPMCRDVAEAKTIYLIGYPIDSYYSDGFIFSREEYSVAPGSTRSGYDEYRLVHGSREWNYLEPFMEKNARWLEVLAVERDRHVIVRYEDMFLDMKGTEARVQNLCGSFRQKFPVPKKNRARLYWTGDWEEKMDRNAFQELQRIFRRGMREFYPERM